MFNLLSAALAEEAAGTASEAVQEAAEIVGAKLKDPSVKDFYEADVKVWLILAGIILLGAIFFAIGKSRKSWSAKAVAYGALSIALSFVLSYVRLFGMPQHGSVTPGSMLPLMLFSAAFGIGPGVAAGLVYGILKYIQDPSFLNVWQFIFDYLIAFSALGLAGLYRHINKKWHVFAALGFLAAFLVILAVRYQNLWWVFAILMVLLGGLTVFIAKEPEKYTVMPAMTVAVIGRAASAVIAGLMWVAEYPGSEGTDLPIVYSIFYNAAYLVPDLLICLVLAALVGKRLIDMMKTN